MTNIQLTEEKETLFITLCAKALDYRSKKSILEDRYADEIVKQVNLDIDKYKGFGSSIIVIRAMQFDEWVKEFLSSNSSAVVVYLGCGLDTRITRISPEADVSWFDVDYPEVINLRKKFFTSRGGYQMISSSVKDLSWLEQIPSERQTLIIAEGILEYLTGEEVKILLNGLTNYFSHGQIIFDVINSFAVESGKEKLKETTGAVHKWAVDDIMEIDKMNFKLKRLNDLSLFKSRFIKQLPFSLRLIVLLVSRFRKFKNLMRLMKYKF